MSIEENVKTGSMFSFEAAELEDDDFLTESFVMDEFRHIHGMFTNAMSNKFRVTPIMNGVFKIIPNNGKTTDYMHVSIVDKMVRAIAHVNGKKTLITRKDNPQTAYNKINNALSRCFGDFNLVSESYSEVSFSNGNGSSLSRFGIIQEANDNTDDTDDDIDDLEELDFDDDAGTDDSSNESKEEKPEATAEVEIEIGSDNSVEQNEYDPKELETVNKLIASEASALSEYFTAAKETKLPILSKVYSDIGDEERFHVEQLLYAKSQITGEPYEPRDLDVKREYEELLAIGMDSESAMATAMDKRSIAADSVPDDTDDEEANEDLESATETLEYACAAFDMYTAILESSNKVNINRCNAIIVESYFMEAVETNDSNAKVKMPMDNPFVLVGKLFKAIINGLKKLTVKFRKWQEKAYRNDKRRRDWIKRHGIKAIFEHGIHLYFYDDARPDMNMFDVFNQLIYRVDAALVSVCKTYGISGFKPLQGNKYSFGTAKQGIQALKNINLTKTKVVVNDQTSAALEKKFFGVSNTKIENSEGQLVSANPYNVFDDCLKKANTYLEENVNKVMQVVDNMPSDMNSVYHKNQKLYNDLCDDMKTITKTLEEIIKAVTNDLSEYVKVNNQATKEATAEADAATNNTQPTEQPKTEEAKTEEAKAEEPTKTEEQPKPANEEQPKVEQPKAEEPKSTEATPAKSEQPQEQPKSEGQSKPDELSDEESVSEERTIESAGIGHDDLVKAGIPEQHMKTILNNPDTTPSELLWSIYINIHSQKNMTDEQKQKLANSYYNTITRLNTLVKDSRPIQTYDEWLKSEEGQSKSDDEAKPKRTIGSSGITADKLEILGIPKQRIKRIINNPDSTPSELLKQIYQLIDADTDMDNERKLELANSYCETYKLLNSFVNDPTPIPTFDDWILSLHMNKKS